MSGLGYDDLFPGFGFPNSALLAPGKAVAAWLTPRRIDSNGQTVSFLWGDGPRTLTGGGTLGAAGHAAARRQNRSGDLP